MKSLKDSSNKILKTSIILPQIEKKVRSIISNADIILYGSRARGEADIESDWDLLILVDQTLDNKIRTDLVDGLYDIELETDEVFSSIIRSKEEWNSAHYSVLPFKRNVEKEGILL